MNTHRKQSLLDGIIHWKNMFSVKTGFLKNIIISLSHVSFNLSKAKINLS